MLQSRGSVESKTNVQASNVTYQATTLLAPQTYAALNATQGGIFTYADQRANMIPIVAIFTIWSTAAPLDPQSLQTVTVRVEGPADQVSPTTHIPSGVATFYLQPTVTTSTWLPWIFGPVPFTSIPIAAAVATSTPSSSVLATGDSSTLSSTQANSTAPSSATPSGHSTTGTVAHKTSYSTGILAGVAIACVFIGIFFTALILFLYFRKGRQDGKRTFGRSEKQRFLPKDHGDAVCTTVITGGEWQKHLPQADPDSTIRAATSRTLDQIAMHVENYYTSSRIVHLSTEDEFALEAIDSSRTRGRTLTMLQHPGVVQHMTKLFISSYLLSMISFDDSGEPGTFLPRQYRRQWNHTPHKSGHHNHDMISSVPGATHSTSTTFDQAYSYWRVLTAHLKQNSGEEGTYTAERDAAIHAAARNVQRAFEPWAKNQDDNRFSNMVGIMKQASDLGVLLFSQPARFEWQWQIPESTKPRGTSSAPTKLVVLPGLYKMTDQNAVPLASPIRLVEPTVVVLEGLS